MEPFFILLQPGMHPDGSVYLEVNISAAGELSICGVVGPRANGNCRGSAGQCREALLELTALSKGWTVGLAHQLYEVWERWHLNHMTAGSPAQEHFLRNTDKVFPGYPVSHYDWACTILAEAGLNPDPNHDGYKYGSAWLKEELPDEVIEFLKSLPPSTKVCPWDSMNHPRRP